MRRILLLLVAAAILGLPAAAAARSHSQSAIGFLVVRNASADRGILGRPVATVVLRGFVIGRISQEGAVALYHLDSDTLDAQAAGLVVSRQRVRWHGQPGTEFSGSSFRFRAVGGFWRVVVYGAGVSLYAGGVGNAKLHGSVQYPGDDGDYSLDGAPFASLPPGVITGQLGTK